MIYEYRRYQAMPGKMGALNARFANHTLRLFQKHGIRVVGFWEAYIGTSNVLHYILAYDSLDARQKAWDAFTSDPEWLQARAESEKDGPLVAQLHAEIWKATPYSPQP